MLLVAETAFCVAMVCGERRKAENTMISFSSNLPKFAFVSSPVRLAPAKDFEQAIKDDFFTIPDVRDVSIDHENEEMVIRIAVANDPPKALRYKIYDKQSALVAAFPSMLFDFSLVHAE